MRGDLAHEALALAAGSMVNAALQHAAPMPVCADLHTVRRCRVVDELRVRWGQPLQGPQCIRASRQVGQSIRQLANNDSEELTIKPCWRNEQCTKHTCQPSEGGGVQRDNAGSYYIILTLLEQNKNGDKPAGSAARRGCRAGP